MKCRFGRGKILCLGPWQAEGDCRSRCAAERERIGACARTKIWASGSLRMRKHPSKVFLVLFLQKKNGTLKLSRAPRLEREIVKTRLRVLTRFPKAREQRTARKKSVARPLKGHILPVGTRPIRQELPRATASVAERKRSRSEVDTGRRIGSSLGLCLFFGCENRLRFSHRAGPSMGLGFGR